MGDCLRAGIPSRYVTSQLGQLSLASLRGRLISSTSFLSRYTAFFSRDAMLARCMLSFLCLSVTSRYCISKRRIEPVLGWHGGFLPPIAHSAVSKFGYLQTLGTSLWYFVPYSGLGNYFATVDLYRKHPRPTSLPSTSERFLVDLVIGFCALH